MTENYKPNNNPNNLVTPQMGEYDEFSRLDAGGNQVRTYTGMGIFNPALVLEEGNFNLVGMNDGVLQACISADDGKLLAGGGAVSIDVNGISIEGTTGVLNPASSVSWNTTEGRIADIIANDNPAGYNELRIIAYGTNSVSNPPAVNTPLIYIEAQEKDDATDAGAIISVGNGPVAYEGFPTENAGSVEIIVSNEDLLENHVKFTPKYTSFERALMMKEKLNHQKMLVQQASDFLDDTVAGYAPFTKDAISGGSTTYKAAEYGHFGIITIKSTGANTNGGARIGYSATNCLNLDPWNLQGEVILRPLSNNTNVRTVFGFYSDNLTSITSTNGEYLTMIGNGTDVTLNYVHRAAGSGSPVAIGNLSINSWYHIVLKINGEPHVYVYANTGALVYEYTSTTNPVTDNMTFGVKAYRASANSTDIVDIDRLDLITFGTMER